MQAPSPRRLSAAHFAFVRCWAEGLDLAQAWDRLLYVDGAGDARKARGKLIELLGELRTLATSHGRPDVAVLLRRDPMAIAEGKHKQPTLDEFAAQQPQDYYTQAELIDLYQEQFGAVEAASPARRRQRLRQRLVEAVQWLQGLDPKPPCPADATTAWLDERVAARLAVVGIRSLGELVFWVGLKGFNWHRRIPKLGPEGAARVVRWLREHEASLGAIPSRSLAPRSQIDLAGLALPAQMGIVPLERFKSPQALDGSQGSNRASAQRCKVAAVNDYEAINAWLRLRIPNSHTWRAYRKEAERFLLWAVLERGKALSSLDGDDCVAYRDFLAAPGPQWVGSRSEQRWSPSWRPFEGPLSPRSQALAMTIVRGLCEWLVRRRYLDTNPWDDVPARPDAPSMPQLRALSARQWGLVQDWLTDQALHAPCPALSRLAFLMNFTYMSGLRLAELAAAELGWLRHEQLDDGEWAWSLMVLGKRNKWREVPLPDGAMKALELYLGSRGLGADPLALGPKTPLVAKLSFEEPLSAARIYDVLVRGFEQAAAYAQAHDAKAAERIRQASTHWLRHTYGSHASARGVPQEVLQANLGHESLATTSIYVRAEKGRKHRAVQVAFAAPAR